MSKGKAWGRLRLDGDNKLPEDVEKIIKGQPPTMVEYKEPGYVEAVNNRIYFYSGIESDRVLQLLKTLKNLEEDILVKTQTWDLEEVPPIHLHIQSYGGYTHAGLAAMDHICNIKVPVYTVIDGVAASAATFLSIVGQKRYIQKHSFTLIHQLSSVMWGTYRDFQDHQKNIDALMEMVRKIYGEFTDVPINKLDEILSHDLYFDAETSVKYGLADEIIEGKTNGRRKTKKV